MRSSDAIALRLRPRRRSARADRGFTVVELVAVLLLVGFVAVVALPRMQSALSLRADAWRDQVLAALRHAQSTATSHRRLVCATVATDAVTLTIATDNPATTCSGALVGPDGHAAYARDNRSTATTVTPSGVLYFQPDGRVTGDGAGTAATDRSIAIAGQPAITVTADTGYVR